jgi:hypothetical protein
MDDAADDMDDPDGPESEGHADEPPVPEPENGPGSELERR